MKGLARRPPNLRWWFILVGVCLLLMFTAAYFPQLRNYFFKPAPFLCVKDEFRTRCPHLAGAESLWENPRAATKDWRACAEAIPDDYQSPPGDDGGNGYIGIIAEGGLNQQRISIINAVAVARIMNCILILPVFKQDSIWKDSTQFADVFDVDHFIYYLKADVRIIREPPDWIPHHKDFYSSIGFTIKNIPKYASAEFYLQNVLPRIKEKKLMSLKPFVDRLGYDNVPLEINKLRCRVNYHALKFLPETERMADILVSRMHNRTRKQRHPYMALHLRFEKGMVGLSFCDFVGTREEKAALREYRKKEWPRRFKNDTIMWKEALCKRKQGKCPMEPGEVALVLKGMGYTKETQIYVASGPVYGGNARMRPLQRMFPNLVRKDDLASKEELAPFQKHVTSLAALDFLVCLKSDVYVMTHGGNFAKLIIGTRRYHGHVQKSIKPNKGLMAYALGDPYMSWPRFMQEVAEMHKRRTGLPEASFPVYDIWENPLSPCMCPSGAVEAGQWEAIADAVPNAGPWNVEAAAPVQLQVKTTPRPRCRGCWSACDTCRMGKEICCSRSMKQRLLSTPASWTSCNSESSGILVTAVCHANKAKFSQNFG